MGGSTVLYLIPARGESKRLPGKNVRDVAGRPLLVWTIDAAQQSRQRGLVCVSTDDEEIAGIGRAAGAEVPFRRPAELATDAASSVDVALHAINYYREIGTTFEYTCLLQPTSPLRDSTDIDAAFNVLRSRNADAVISVCETEHSPLWTNMLPEDGALDHFFRPESMGKRSQDLPQYYRLNGAIYLVKTTALIRSKTFAVASGGFAYVMPAARSIDVDTETDLELARLLLSRPIPDPQLSQRPE